MTHHSRMLILVAGAAVLLAAGISAQSDDTEIYISHATDRDDVNPNVLFIIDTSSSMRGSVEITTEFDPSKDYADGRELGCEDDYVFYSRDTEAVPPCDSTNRFESRRLVCSRALEALYGAGGANATGVYTDQFGGWTHRENPDRSRWRSGGAGFDRHEHYECEDDKGNHGASSGGPSWPADGKNGPWSADAPNAPPWKHWETYTLYSANYVRWHHYHETTSTTSRLEVVKRTVKALVDSVSNINIGLMRFDSTADDFGADSFSPNSQGGAVVMPVSDIDAPGVRDEFKRIVDALRAKHQTPLSETLYEAMRYYRGQPPQYGVRENGTPSHPDSIRGGRYDSPIDNECGEHYIVLLSDGLPTFDDDADLKINRLLDDTNGLTPKGCAGPASQEEDADDCVEELAEYLYRTDSAPWLDGKQNIATYTVGLDIPTSDALLNIATRAGGRYYFANTAQALASAFTHIVQKILRNDRTSAPPAVSINAFNRLEHRDDIYFTVFRPDNRPHWDGNLKKFRFARVTDGHGNAVDHDRDGEDDFAILDANGRIAVDENSGLFKSTARSFLTLDDFAPDGNQAGVGGFAGRLYDYAGTHDPSTREHRVYTYTATDNGGGGRISDLTHPANRVHEDNARLPGLNDSGRITRDMIGASAIDDESFRSLLKWARGLDLNDEDDDGDTSDGRPTLGAPLHAKPLLITYLADRSTGAQKDYLFVATNDGYLHMLSTEDPSGSDSSAGGARLEKWAFVPPDMLGNLRTIFHNSSSTGIQYGLDGGMDVWMNDVNGDYDLLTPGENGGAPTLDSGEHAYLYFGQRRGGRAYYALDVTEPERPAFLWSISGDNAAPSDPLSRLGQTWSRPRHTRIFMADATRSRLVQKDVIIIGGGYDPGQDAAGGTRVADTMGNAVFILDAKTGAVLWWTGNTAAGGTPPDLALDDMRYSIPGDIRIIDVNGDGVLDRFYAADTGGQIWRFDISNDEPQALADRVTGGRIADLQPPASQSAGTAASDNRRFYYPPDVSAIVPPRGRPFHAIAIGSGYRAHPNDTVVEDRIYVIRDYAVNAPPEDEDGSIVYRTLYESDLLDVTARPNVSTLTDDEAKRLASGWYLSLDDGEKALAGAVTANGAILLTTFTPAGTSEANTNESCAPSEGTARIYALNAIDGSPVANLDRNGGSDPEKFSSNDRYQNLERRGIPPEVTILFPGVDASPIPVVGTEIVPMLKIENTPTPTYWFEHDAH